MTSSSHIPDERRQVSIFLLTMLQAILNEQQEARTLDKKTADYIYAAVKDQAIRQGWISQERPKKGAEKQ